MKLVGEAFKDNALSLDLETKVTVLGIANWCTVTNYHKLINRNKVLNQSILQILYTAIILIVFFSFQDNKTLNVVNYELIKPPLKLDKKGNPLRKHELLDPNHTHFILVDDAYHDFRGEVKFRADLEERITKVVMKNNDIPTVVLVIGGGPGTAQFVYETVKKNTPCVFLDVQFLPENFFLFCMFFFK
jgi:hypothetical protein